MRIGDWSADVCSSVLLGPIFARVLGDGGWDAHLAKMCDFWSSVLLMTGRYAGRPMPAHVRIDTGDDGKSGAGLDATHFARWSGLFKSAARREGQGGGNMFRSRWVPLHEKKKKY